jgi:hypothetical protein
MIERWDDIPLGEVVILSEPKYIGSIENLPHREIPMKYRPASVCMIDGVCLHANKCFYNLYVKMLDQEFVEETDICYMRYCSDCKKILTDQGQLMSHALFVELLADCTYNDEEKKILLENFEGVNGHD